jgi:hypothetical protein
MGMEDYIAPSRGNLRFEPVSSLSLTKIDSGPGLLHLKNDVPAFLNLLKPGFEIGPPSPTTSLQVYDTWTLRLEAETGSCNTSTVLKHSVSTVTSNVLRAAT